MMLKQVLESSINERVEKFTFPWIKNEMIKILKLKLKDDGLKYNEHDFDFNATIIVPNSYYGSPLKTNFLGRNAYICGNLSTINIKYKNRKLFSERYHEAMILGDTIANVSREFAMIMPSKVKTDENLFDDKYSQNAKITNVYNNKMHKFYEDFESFEKVSSKLSYYNNYKVPENKVKKIKTFIDKEFYKTLLIDFEHYVNTFDFIEEDTGPVPMSNKKKITNKTLKVGDYIFSKNDYEFNAKVIEIKNGNVTVEYGDEYDTGVVPLSIVKYDYTINHWSMPNWSV
jgi:hypothetical protein